MEVSSYRTGHNLAVQEWCRAWMDTPPEEMTPGYDITISREAEIRPPAECFRVCGS